MTAIGKALAAIGVALVLACCLLLPAQAQDELVITLSRLAGTVEVMHSEATDGVWTAASVGARLSAGWTLRTGEGGKAQLSFPRDNVVILKENSVLYVEDLEYGGGGTVASDSGDFLVNLRNALSPGSEFEVKTPSALAVVRGTKFGVSVDGDRGAVFFGYENTVEIINEHGMSLLVPGTTVMATPDAPPSDPMPSSDEAAAFASDAEDEEAFAGQEEELAAWRERFERELADAQALRQDMDKYHDQWQHYFERDETAKCMYLYAQVLIFMERVDARSGRFLEVVREPAGLFLAAAWLSIPTGDGSQLGADGFADLAAQLEEAWLLPEDAPLGVVSGVAAQEYAQIYEAFEDIADDAEPLIGDNEDALDHIHGLLSEDDIDPDMDMGMIIRDSDNDGLSDVEEEILGTDPHTDESQDGFITLLSPGDGAQFAYPDDEEIEFAFEPLDSDYIESYNLVLEAGGRQFMQANVEDSEDVTLALLAGPGGAFLDAADAAGVIGVQWYIAANVDEGALANELSPGGRAGVGFGQLTSAVRSFTIQLPAVSEGVVLDIMPSDDDSVEVGERLRVVGEISEVANLGQFEIEVSYDPSLLEFENGRKLGDFASSTLFFSDYGAGIVRITGVTDLAQAADGIEGVVFELEFTALEPGEGFIEVSSLSLVDTLEREIDAGGGEEAEYAITVPPASANDLPDYQDDPGKPGTWR